MMIETQDETIFTNAIEDKTASNTNRQKLKDIY